jgi:D-alanine-D-alanine ligase
MVRKIAVVYGGWSSEAEVSRKSGKAVAKGLKKLGYEVIELELTPRVAVDLLELKPDCVFPILHGKPGEDGAFQGLLEILRIPFVGENVKVSAICMDKDWTKKLLKEEKLPTPKWTVFYKDRPLGDIPWNTFPAVVKPAEEGSSVGLKIVKNQKELTEALKTLKEHYEKILIEEFIPGREFTCGFVSGEILPPLEIKPKKGIYDFKAKYTKGETEFLEVEEPLREKIQQITLKVIKVLEIKYLARVDFRYHSEKGTLFITEVNTIPGMTETSLLPLMVKKRGFSFERLLKLLLENCKQYSR